MVEANIGWAISRMREGEWVCREGWNGKGMYLFLVSSVGDMQEYVCMKTAQDTLVPWLCSQSDLLADDWQIVNKETANV